MGNFCGEASEDKGQTMKEAPGNEGIRQFEEQRVRRQPTGGNTFTTNLMAKESSDSGGMSPGEQMARFGQGMRPMPPGEMVARFGKGMSPSQKTSAPNMLGGAGSGEMSPGELMARFGQATRPTSNVSLPISKTDPIVKKEMDANPYLSKIRDFVGGILGYDTSTLEGLKKMEADRMKSDKFYQAGQDDRNKEIDKENMRTNIQGVGTPLDPCPEGYVYNEESQKCEPVEEQTDNMTFTKNPMGLQSYMNQFASEGQGNVPLSQYGRVGGEYDFFMNQGGPPRGPQGEIQGAGGPKDDLVGPFMLSNKEYVLPNEQIKMYGGGNYETGVKRLERDRKNALKNNK